MISFIQAAKCMPELGAHGTLHQINSFDVCEGSFAIDAAVLPTTWGPFRSDCVAKLSLRLRLNRDSVDQDCDSRGAVDDGAARARAKSILLRVRSRQGGAGRSFG